MNWTKLAGRITRFLIYLFLLCPLLVIIITAFSDTNRVVFPPKGFTLRWFQAALQSAEFTASLLLSIRIAVVSVFIACVLGTMISLWFWKSDNRFKSVFGERLDVMLNDALYGILFRDINMQRTIVDQFFSRVINGYAGVIINTCLLYTSRCV